MTSAHLLAISRASAATANLPDLTIIGFLKSSDAVPLYLLIVLIVYILQLYYRNRWFKKTPKPLKKKILKSLPKLTLSQEECFVTIRVSRCVICLEDYVVDDVVRVLPHCGHEFHASCVDKWFQFGSTCPSCRRVPVAHLANYLQPL